MNIARASFARRPAGTTTARRLAVAALVLASCAAGAQQVYRIVGPDGRVTFSDKPPTEPGAKAGPAPTVGMPGGAGGGALPYELRQTASKFPVTLYTGPECNPCGAGRSFLGGRGIPFSEKTVTTAEDAAALERLTGSAPALPVLTIGGQQLKGFSETEWSQFLDAAGYPRTSQLPANYRQAAATPLVVVSRPAEPQSAPSAAAAPAPVAPAPAAAPGSNPAGIRF
jgi:glutaredoxin